MTENTLRGLFKKIHKYQPEVFSSAPGRINIIGEHTDYNKGYVLPAAINFRNFFLGSRRDDNRVFLWAENLKQEECFFLNNVSYSKQKRWANYVKGIFWILKKEGFLLQGINGLLWGNIPLEAGLSSSAALEISVINCLDRLFSLDLSPEKKAFLAQRAENDFVGVKCGIMDQFISVYGQKKKAMFLDCETLRFELIPLNLKKKLSILVYDSQVRRELAASQYNKRRQEADLALSHLKKNGYESFKDVNLTALEKMRKKMDEIIYRRTKHIVSENMRVNSAVQALKEDNFHLLGELLFLSHESLRNDYEVSCPELDLLYETGRDFSGCLGARLTGAGFGGSGIALVKKEKVEDFKKKAIEAAQEKAFPEPKIFEISVGKGASDYCLAKERKK